MKKITSLLIIVLAITSVGCGCSFNSIRGTGNEVTKAVEVSEFSKIDASHAFEIDVIVGDKNSVTVETDDNLLKYVKIYTKNDVLYLGTENNVSLNGNIKVVVYTKALTSVDLSGACKIDVKNIDTNILSVDFSGACKGKFTGKVKTLNLDLSGATKLNTVDLIAQNLNADLSGASKLDVYCENELFVDASGASKINVYGNPKSTKTDFSGASSVNFK
jgi:uncharacterized protein YjbI with pentapeptide repeats